MPLKTNKLKLSCHLTMFDLSIYLSVNNFLLEEKC